MTSKTQQHNGTPTTMTMVPHRLYTAAAAAAILYTAAASATIGITTNPTNGRQQQQYANPCHCND